MPAPDIPRLAVATANGLYLHDLVKNAGVMRNRRASSQPADRREITTVTAPVITVCVFAENRKSDLPRLARLMHANRTGTARFPAVR